jgi:hypothetical protein
VASGGRRNCHSAHQLPARFSRSRDRRVWFGRRNIVIIPFYRQKLWKQGQTGGKVLAAR